MNDILLWYTTRAAGAVSLVLLTGVVVLGILTALRVSTANWPGFLTAGLHRNLGLLSVVFLALHILTAVVDPYTHLGWMAAVIPFSSYYRTVWLGLGTIAAELVAALVVTSLVRGRLGHGSWRAIHWLAYASWPVALAHSLGTGTDATSAWFFVIGVACASAVVVATLVRLWLGPRDPLAAGRAAFRETVRREPSR
jgi:sulfoxide reductase heme-binding subunit YedZ